MRRAWLIAVVLVLSVNPRVGAIEKPYQTGTIVDVQQKAHERVLLYLVNTPITEDEPYFEVSVRLHDGIYVGEYTPIHSSETLPGDWRRDAAVQVRLRDKYHMFLKRPDGREVSFVIVKRVPSEPAQKVPRNDDKK